MLYSYGFVSVEIQTQSGEKLELRPHIEATLRFQVPWQQAQSSPDSIPLWHFKEATAIWEQVGWSYKTVRYTKAT